MTKQLQVYQYIQQGHSQKDAAEHFTCDPSYVSRCVKIESARHGVKWVDGRLYKPANEVMK